ncbi:Arginyl-tRNA--protein transferase 1 [Linnemannia schmuckeri]|uniref:Arginyl-tRNA--protein transferase 1 n=1 Tax=Linnemannia schmuckeri TaxID=64567 RepID=A0A9P5RT99_9FUNG|nr:Arginyl-tRNA--protein transferase 1 [Linnemannia schmuckeri]
MLLSDFSVITPYGTNVSSCGYCKSTGGSRTYGMSAHIMTCKDYQLLINRGWRRSGRYLYKPNLRDSCCPQYTIRMRANDFEASKHQRQIVNRFNNFVQEGDDNFDKDIAARQKGSQAAEKNGSAKTKSEAGSEQTTTTEVASSTMETTAATSSTGKKQKPRKAPKNVATDLRTRIRSSEYLHSPDITSWKHRLRIKLEPSSFTEEKHALYTKYQMEIHHEPRSKCQPKSFTNFLIDSPLTASKPDDWTEEDPGYGSFHQCYYLDEKLIAVSVIDILPSCVSAVYFFYDPDYSVLSLGKYSAQREIALVQTLNAKPGYEELKFYYMGFYIFTCQKMTYKGQFHPSYLLDPETYNWIEFKKCQEILKDQRYSAFEHPTPLDPLFEAKIKSIIDKKQGASSESSHDDDDDDDEDGDDGEGGWGSVDEEDDEFDLDPDEFNARAVDDSDGEVEDFVEGGSDRKKKKLNIEHEKGGQVDKAKEEAKAAKAAKKARRKEMDRVFKEVTALPPPGCLTTKDVTQLTLLNVLCLTDKNALRPIVAIDAYKKYKELRNVVAEYYCQVGEELANSMILYVR